MREAVPRPTVGAEGVEGGASSGRGRWLGMWRRGRHARWVRAGAVLMILLAAVLVLPRVLGVESDALSDAQWEGPSLAHWMGTDANGRDLLARVCEGTLVSLVVGLAGSLVSLVIGVAWGLVAGYLGGRWDGVMMRTVDVLYSMPSILFVIVMVTMFQGSVSEWLGSIAGRRGSEAAPIVFLILGLGGVSWLTMARIVRARVLTLRRMPFMDAARALGAGPARLLLRHLLPNSAGVIVVYLTLTIPAIVLGESFLSFLGLGVQPPGASLGSLLADGAGQINPLRTAWMPLAGPGTVLVALLLSLSLLGDGLRDLLDPLDRPKPE
ncbi:MAG: ABC transporter permease [Limisphaerales bacterium]